MELRKIKIVSPHFIDQQIEIRFELFDWLKNKNLSAEGAAELLELTAREIRKSALAEKL